MQREKRSVDHGLSFSQSLAWSEFCSEFCLDHGLSFVPRSQKLFGRGRPEVIVKQGLKDEDMEVRWGACRCLAKLPEQALLIYAEEILQRGLRDDEGWEVHSKAPTESNPNPLQISEKKKAHKHWEPIFLPNFYSRQTISGNSMLLVYTGEVLD